MSQSLILSGVDGASFKESLRTSLRQTRPQVIGIAAAFVSSSGVEELSEILRSIGRPRCRLIAGIDKAITHPEALYAARELRWETRLGSAPQGIFHPKIFVAGNELSAEGVIRQLCCVYIGSSNLTAGGLRKNVECGLIAHDASCPAAASNVFARLWDISRPATEDELRNYAARFAEAARRRKASELDDLGISDSRILPAAPADLLRERPPSRPAVPLGFAVAAWAGLQSFTGEYRFQLEFPKAAGRVISQLLQLNRAQNAQVEVYCPDDASTRRMQFKYYGDNGMFRLNIPNDVPGVAWARQHKDGIAVIEKGPHGGAPLRLQFLKPGADANEIVRRSVALGTWGRTPTRTYGWY